MSFTEKITVLVGADVKDFQAGMARVTNTINNRMSMIGTGVTSIVPALATATLGAGALGAGFATAGVSAIGFGVIATGVLGDVFDASKKLEQAQEALDNAKDAKERANALEKQKEALTGLSEEQKRALTSLQSFKSFWDDFKVEFEKPVVDLFTKSLSGLKVVLDALKPAFLGGMSAMEKLGGMMENAFKSPDIQKFFSWLGTSGSSQMVMFGESAGNVMRGVINMLMAFSPFADRMGKGLVNLTAQFADWSNTLSQSKGFQQFVSFAQENAPVLISAIGNILKITGKLLTVLAPVGSVLLKLVDGVLSLADAGLGALMPAFGAVYDKVNQLWGAFQNSGALSTVADYFKQVTSGADGLGNSFSRIFGTLKSIVEPILTDLVAFIGEMFGRIKKFWDENGAQIIQAVKNLWSIIADIFEFISPVISFIVETLWESVKGIISGALDVIMGLIKVFAGLFTGDFGKMWEGIKEMFFGAIEFIWNWLNLMFIGRILGGIKSLVTGAGKWIVSMWEYIVGVFKAKVNTVVGYAVELKNLVVGAFNALRNMGSSIMQSIRAIISIAWQAIKNTALRAVTALKEGAISIFNGLKSTVTSIFNAVKSAITNPIETAKKAVLKIIDVIKSAFSALKITIPKPKLPNISVTKKIGVLGIPYPDFDVSWKATGGIATGASIVGVGEKGDEAIVPLSDKSRMRPFAEAVASMMPNNGKDGVTIINNWYIEATVKEEADAEKLAQEITKLQFKNQRKFGGVTL